MSRALAESHPFVGCTTATVRYLPGARVLARSWRQHHPHTPFFVLLADGDDRPGESGLFEVIRPDELGLSPDELAIQRGIYDAGEFSTALKPHLLRHLLDRGASSVVFSDADTDVYAGLDHVAAAAATHGLALTPHVLRPIPGDGMTPTQIEYQQIESGLFNTGLLAVADGGPYPLTGGAPASHATASTRDWRECGSTNAGRTGYRRTSSMLSSVTRRSTSRSGTCTSGRCRTLKASRA